MAKILLADDDVSVRKAFRRLLEGEGHSVMPAKDGIDCLEKIGQFAPDILLVDVMMPRMGGIALCRKIRETDPLLPIIFFTAAPDDVSAVRAFGCGADDYIDKAKSPAEFISRISAALRRSPYMSAKSRNEDAVTLPGVKIDFGRMCVESSEGICPLTRSEALILHRLIEKRGRVCSAEELFSAIFGDGYTGDESAIRKHISRIREKLGPAGSLIVNDRALGYRLVE